MSCLAVLAVACADLFGAQHGSMDLCCFAGLVGALKLWACPALTCRYYRLMVSGPGVTPGDSQRAAEAFRVVALTWMARNQVCCAALRCAVHRLALCWACKCGWLADVHTLGLECRREPRCRGMPHLFAAPRPPPLPRRSW